MEVDCDHGTWNFTYSLGNYTQRDIQCTYCASLFLVLFVLQVDIIIAGVSPIVNMYDNNNIHE